MPTIPLRRRSPTKPSTDVSVNKRLDRVEAELAHAQAEREELRAALRQVEENAHALEIQFKRIAEIQADLDEIKRAWTKAKATT